MNRTNLTRLCAVLVVATSVAGCGGGDSGGSSSSSSVTPPPVITPPVENKLAPRPALRASNDSAVYKVVDQFYVPSTVEERIGQLSFAYQPSGIVEDNHDGRLKILNTGFVTVTVTDTAVGYESSTTTFDLTINKGVNDLLDARPLYLKTQGNDQQKPLVVRDAQGEVQCQVVSGYEALLTVNSCAEVRSNGISGEGKVLVRDLGNQRYQQREIEVPVTVSPVNTAVLSFKDLSADYQQGLTLGAVKQSGSETTSIKYAVRSVEPKVIEINPTTGFISVLRAGSAIVDVEVTYPSSYDRDSEKTSFNVLINRSNHPDLFDVSEITLPYEADAIVQPHFKVAPAEPVQYTIEITNGAVVYDDQKKKYVIADIGETELKVTVPRGDKYNAWSKVLTYKITTAAHPGLVPFSTITHTYQPELALDLNLVGKKGVIVLDDTIEANRVEFNKDKQQVIFDRVGEYSLSMYDEGTRHYLRSPSVTQKFNIVKAQRAPLPELPTLTQTYADNTVVELGDKLNSIGRTLEIIDISDTSVVEKYNPSPMNLSLSVKAVGTTQITVREPGDVNHLPSESKQVTLHITSVANHISLADELTHIEKVWSPSDTSIGTPKLEGTHGKLSFVLANGAPTGVVTVNTDGSMQVLGVGKTQVTVTDQGKPGYDSGSFTFDVIVKKRELPERAITADSVRLVYGDEATITPKLVLVGSEAPLSEFTFTYSLSSEYEKIVKRLDASTGKLEVVGAGEYQLDVVAQHPNYNNYNFVAKGVIEQADHLGIVANSLVVPFHPYKIYQADVTSKKLGERRFSYNSYNVAYPVSNFDGTFRTRRYVAASGTNNYDTVNITELASQNYREGTGGFQILVLPPVAEQADFSADVVMDSENAKHVVISQLGGKTTANLEETMVTAIGMSRVDKPSDADVTKHGDGFRIVMEMKRVDQEVPTEMVSFYMTRNDGCGDDPAAITFGAVESCESGELKRSVTFYNLEENNKLTGHWKSTVPLTLFRKGRRPFIKSDQGGAYDDKADSALRTYEWAVINFEFKN